MIVRVPMALFLDRPVQTPGPLVVGSADECAFTVLIRRRVGSPELEGKHLTPGVADGVVWPY